MGLKKFVGKIVSPVLKFLGVNPLVALGVSLFLSWVLRPKVPEIEDFGTNEFDDFEKGKISKETINQEFNQRLSQSIQDNIAGVVGPTVSNVGSSTSGGGTTSGGTTSGNRTSTSQAISQFSDIRLKKNINDIPYGLGEVLQLRGVEFDWKEKRDGKHDIGVIAQEIEKIIPEVVQESKDLNSDTMYKSVDYGKLTAVLIKSIQELTERIEELEGDK